jgi:hypothetical protein
MRLPGAVGIDSRDRRGVRRGASEILTSLMLVYVAQRIYRVGGALM